MATPLRPAAAPARVPGWRRWLPDVALALVLLLLPLLRFWPLFTPHPRDQMTLVEGDFNIEFFPQIHAISTIVRGGELPLWNPWSDAGQPLMADPQMAIWYPPNWVLPWLVRDIGAGSLVALEAHTVLQLGLLAITTYLLGRAVIGSRLGALVAALVFAFSGLLTSYPVQQVPIVRCAVWFPLLLLCLIRALDRFSLRWALAGGLALALAILAGHPQLLLFQLYGLALYSVYRLWELRRTPRAAVHAALLGAVMGALGIGLAAIQLVPSLEFLQLSDRAASSYQFTAAGFSPFEIVLDSLAPRITGGVPLYVGVLPLLLAVVAVGFVRQRLVVYFALLGAVGLLVSLGGNSFAHGVLYLFAPGFALFQHQERAIYLYVCAVALLAGYGAAWLERPLGPSARRQLLALGRMVLAGVAAALVVAAVLYAGWLLVEGTPRAARWRVAIDWWNWFVLMLAAALAVLALRLRWRHGQGLLRVAAPLLIVLDLFTVGWGVNLAPRPPDQVFVPSEIVRWLQREPEPYRLDDRGVLNGNSGLVYLLPSVNGAYGMFVARFSMLKTVLPPHELWRLLNVRFVVTREPPWPGVEVGIEEPYLEHVNRVVVLHDVLPRALVVPRGRVVSDAEALGLLREGRVDLRREVLLAEEPPAIPPEGSGQAHVVRYGANQLEVAVEATGGYLLLSEIYFPGWRAEVDGAPRPLLRANYGLRAVPLQPGDRVVRLVYAPDSLRWGAAITLVALALGAALFALAPRLERRLGAQGPGQLAAQA
jgi:hypothetical protein